jgi:predicted kinase
MATLLVPVGLPGSGKSSWAHAMAWENPDIEVVSASQIRHELFGSLSEAHNKNGQLIKDKHRKVFEIFHNEIDSLLLEDKTVIADAGNVKFFTREKLIEIALSRRARVEAIIFAADLTVQEVNKNRPKDDLIPLKTIETMISHFKESCHNIKDEGFHLVHFK